VLGWTNSIMMFRHTLVFALCNELLLVSTES
jgi:hypothetical protein